MVKMRRVPAILLTLVFSFSLIAPALSPHGESDLPACCRRDGKHHCAMMGRDMAEAPSSGPVADAVHVKCPLFPSGRALVPECGPALVAPSHAARITLATRTAEKVHTEAGYRISLSRSHHKRGPPTLVS